MGGALAISITNAPPILRTEAVLVRRGQEASVAKATIGDLEGGAALCAWFEGIPSFHDATLRELELRQGAPGRLVAHTFRMESEVDAQGYFLLTKHVDVTLTILEL